MNTWARVITLVFVVAILVFTAVYVWPTRWIITHSNVGGGRVVVRIDRFNGEAERLTRNGWERMEPRESAGW